MTVGFDVWLRVVEIHKHQNCIRRKDRRFGCWPLAVGNRQPLIEWDSPPSTRTSFAKKKQDFNFWSSSRPVDDLEQNKTSGADLFTTIQALPLASKHAFSTLGAAGHLF